MGQSQLYEDGPAVFTGGSTLNIQQVDSVDPTFNIEPLIISGAGSVNPLQFSTARADTKWKIASRDVQTILTTVNPLTGFPSAGKFQYRKQATGGGDYVSGSVHYNVTTPAGFLYVDEFGAKQGDKEGMDIALLYQCLFDGTTPPCTMNAGQALASSVAVHVTHSMGPVIMEGAQLVGCQSSRVKMGSTLETKDADGDLWPSTCRIKERRTIFEVECLNMGVVSALTMNQLVPIDEGITLYYLANVDSAGRVDIGTASHLAFYATSGAYRLVSLTGGKGESKVAKFEVHLDDVMTYSVGAEVEFPE